MTDVTHNSHIQRTIIRLLNHYSFDSENRPMPFVVADWMGCYPLQWIVAAIVEALYQGRYKTISVEQILIIWQRRGRPLHHFNGEFERIVCGQLDVSSAAYKEEPSEALAMELSVLTQENLATNRIANTLEAYRLESSTTHCPASVDGSAHDADNLGHDCMGNDRRLSEMLGDEIMRDEVSSLSGSPHMILDMAKHATSLKQRDSESHKIPVAVFEPLDKTAQALEWQQLTGATIRHHPIHQFTPIKASSTMHNKLKAIAHSHRRALSPK